MDPNVFEKLDQIISLLKDLKSYNDISKKNLFKSFLTGISYALGATVGVAVLLALAGLIVKLLGGVPVIGQFFLDLGKFLHK